VHDAGVRPADQVIAVGERREVRHDACRWRDRFERDEDPGDEDEREADEVEEGHDVPWPLGRIRREECPHGRKAERGEEHAGHQHGDARDRGVEEGDPGGEWDDGDPGGIQEPTEALAQDKRVEGYGGGEEPVECLGPPLDRDRDRLDRGRGEEDGDRDQPRDHDSGLCRPPDGKREKHEEWEECAHDDDVGLEEIDAHVLLRDRPCGVQLAVRPGVPAPPPVSQRSFLPGHVHRARSAG